jgi:HAD superfamily hydrolase (TIGR01490 family)
VVQAAFFDLDKTVIAKASLAAFWRPLRRGGLLSRRLVARAIVAHLTYLYLGADEGRMSRIKDGVLAGTKGWNRDEVRQIVRDALFETVEPIIYSEALELISEHRSLGHRVYLVSASPEELVEPLAEVLGADGAVASRAEMDADGCYTGQMAFYASGANKVAAIEDLAARHGLDLSQSWAYSDSATDLGMLELVGHPVPVNPDRALARIAREREWEVREFTKPVRLRNRVSPRVPLATAGLAAAAAVLAWRWGRRPRAHLRPATGVRV